MERPSRPPLRGPRGDRPLAWSFAVLATAFAFVCGAFAGGGSAGPAVVGTALVAAAFGFALFPRHAFAASCLFGCAVICGAWYALAFARLSRPLLVPDLAGMVRGTVSGDPDVFDARSRFVLDLAAPSRGRAVVLAPRFPEPQSGDLVLMSVSRDERPSLFAGRWGVRARRVEIERHVPSRPAMAPLFALKRSLIASFRAALPSDEAALMSGLLLGDRTGFSPAFTAAMRESGTTHLVALSGYNIGIVIWAVSSAIAGLFSRQWTIALTVLAIIVFVLLVGAEASVVRAAIMGVFALAARFLGRTAQVLRGTVLAAFAMTVANPLAPRFDIGFQLSFVSFFGIVFLGPLFARWFGASREDVPFAAPRSVLAETLAAQAAVLPLIIHAFGSVSGVAVLANLAVLPVVPVAMGIGALAGAAGLAAPAFGTLLSWAAYPFLRYATGAIGFFSGIAGPFAVTAMPFWIVVPAYAALVLGAIRHHRSSP